MVVAVPKGSFAECNPDMTAPLSGVKAQRILRSEDANVGRCTTKHAAVGREVRDR